MKAHDCKEFKEAMNKEIAEQMNHGNFKVMKRSSLPPRETVLPAVWQMKRKRYIMTQEIIKHKARLKIDGFKMRQGIHFT